MQQRSRKVQIRLTDEEIKLIRDKSVAFGGMSQYLRAAVAEFSNIDARGRLESINSLGDYYRQYHNELYHVSANLNQVVKRANELSVAGLLSTPYLRHVVIPAVNETNQVVSELKHLLLSVTRRLTKDS